MSFENAVRSHEERTGHNDPEIIGTPDGAALVCHICRSVLKQEDSR